MAFRFALLDDYAGVALECADWASLSPRVEVVAFTDAIGHDPEAVVRRLQDFDGVMALRERTPLPAAVLERLPKLRLIVTAGMRNASIDVAAARRLGIAVCGTGSLPYPTAELATGLLIAWSRRIPFEERALREGRWQTTVGQGLNGKTLGVIGLGNLGSRVARIALAMEMEVIAWSANLTDERARAVGVVRVAKDELLARADFVSLHLVLSERTRHTIGRDDLARMKPTACLVNTARAGLVDGAALIEALQRGTIAGAAIDVYDREPLPSDAPILAAPNTVLTPHLGYVTAETLGVFYGEALEDVAAFLDGAPVRVLNA